jgi:uncharacterized protein YraI
MLKKKTIVATLGTAVALAALTTTPALAAGPYIGSNSGGANVRTCPNTSCSAVRYLYNGTPVTMYCWVDSQWVYPPASDYSSPRWFRISGGGATGYAHSSLVENQSSVPHC